MPRRSKSSGSRSRRGRTSIYTNRCCRSDATQGARWAEKTPWHVKYLDRVLDTFPQAQIAHILRDPRDIVLSMRRMPWRNGNMISWLAYWRSCVEEVPTNARLNAGNYHEVHFEDLVRSFETEAERLCTFLDIPFDDRMRTYWEHREGTESITEPWRQRALEPPQPDAIERWKTEMKPRELALAEALAGSSLAKAGYEPSGAPAFDSQPAWRAYRAWKSLENRLLLWRNRLRHWRKGRA